MDFLKTIGGKIAAGVTALAVVIGAISWWQMDLQTRNGLLSGTGHLVAWLIVVGALPWALFFVIGRVNKLESNAAGAALVLGITALEAILLGMLFGWHHGTMAWTFLCAAVLLAGVYNLFSCDWIAEKVT